MGEYAIRKSDRQEIKIGTCEEMFYLRYEDRDKVEKLPNSLDPATTMGLYFRLPFIDEDNLRPGDYEDHSRGLRLYRMVETNAFGRQGERISEDYHDPDLAQHPGTIQLTHKSGLLLNVPCYHGERLPDVGEGMKAFWNGKSHSIELSSVKSTEEGPVPIIHCRHCHQAWRSTWAELWEYIEKPMRDRFIERRYLNAATTLGVQS